MKFINAIGGRKFLKGLLLIAVGTLVELAGPRGLTPTMAGFLVSMGAAYFLANVSDKRAVVPTSDSKLDTLIDTASNTQQGVSLLVQYVNTIAK